MSASTLRHTPFAKCSKGLGVSQRFPFRSGISQGSDGGHNAEKGRKREVQRCAADSGLRPAPMMDDARIFLRDDVFRTAGYGEMGGVASLTDFRLLRGTSVGRI